MRKAILFLIFILIVSFNTDLKAQHIRGYDLSLIAQGNDLYKIRLKYYRNIYSINMPATIIVNIAKIIDNSIVMNSTLQRVQQNLVTYDSKDCLAPQANTTNELNVYESAATNLSALNSINGYYIVANNCCRMPGDNITYSGDYGIILTMDFPRLDSNSLYRNNSSPEFKKDPQSDFCVNKSYTLDWEVEDQDNDSLVFSLAQPLGSSSPRPFIGLPWQNGYGLNLNILDGSPDLTINPQTGVINFTPKYAGQYLVAFKCEEFRNGIKIGEVRRDYTFTMWNCPESPPSLIDSKKRSNSIIDTIYVSSPTQYENNFNVYDLNANRNENINLKLIPDTSLYNDILDSNKYNISWGKVSGIKFKGDDIKNLILNDFDSLKTQFVWLLDSTDIKKTPYKFKLVYFDDTCPTSLFDTTEVEIHVIGQCYDKYTSSIFACDSVFDKNGLVYYSDTVLIDTTFSNVGCDIINTQNLNVINSPSLNKIIGDSIILDTSKIYYYEVDSISNLKYNWNVINGKIVTSTTSNKIGVKWEFVNKGEIYCTTYYDSTCLTITNFFINILVGVNDKFNTDIIIYPNPVMHNIQFEGLRDNILYQIQIFDISGKLVLESTINKINELNINELHKGLYILKINDQVHRLLKL